jgi:hypothetical protein
MATTVPNPNEVATPEEIIQQLRLLQQRIPQFEQLPLSARKLLRLSSISPAFEQGMLSAIDKSSALQAVVGQTPVDLRQESSDIARWSSVLDEVSALVKGMNNALTTRRYNLGQALLQAYQASRQLVRTKQHAELIPHVDSLKGLNKFGRKRAETSSPQSQPGPLPVPKTPALMNGQQ